MKDIIIENIRKTYNKGKVIALNDISFSIEKGELFGLIGPDGAGKTSLFRILTTLLLPDRGRVEVAGFDVIKKYRQIRKIAGYMPGRFALYPDLTVEENLNFFATVFHATVEANYDLIKEIYVQIEPFKKRLASKLSGGMKQKLALCCALIHRPRVLFLDEPTTGVDPVSRKEFWEMLQRLQGKDLTILVSTPYMDEAALCDRIVLMNHGNILDLDSPQGIIQKFKNKLWAVKARHMYELLNDLRSYEHTQSCFGFGESHHLVLNDDQVSQPEVIDFLQGRGHQELSMKQIVPSIEDCFMALEND